MYRPILSTPWLAAGLMCCLNSSVFAQLVNTTSYQDSRDNSRWEFTWNGNLPAVNHPFQPAGQNEWEVDARIEDGPDANVGINDFRFDYKHDKPPHGETDKPSHVIRVNDANTLANTAGALMQLGNPTRALHKNKDYDLYVVNYRANGAPAAGRQVQFIITSAHSKASTISFLDGQSVVDPSDSLAVGDAVFDLDENAGELFYALDITGLDLDGLLTPADIDDDITGVHIHSGAPGEEGDILYSLFGPTHDVDDGNVELIDDEIIRLHGVWDDADLELGADELLGWIGQLAAGHLYLDVHTVGHPDGAIRGQIVTPLPGDLDADFDVDIDDLNIVRNLFGESGPADGTLIGDSFPYDGLVNIDDLNAVRNNFGIAAAVPEPSSAILIWWTLALIAVRRR